MITGDNLLNWGFKPGPAFGKLLEIANGMAEHDISEYQIIEVLKEEYDENWKPATLIPLQEKGMIKVVYNIDEGRDEHEIANVQAVKDCMEELVRVPTIRAASVMPDACPAGTIPVGAIVVAENAIHPGMHSADICCSMFLTSLNSDIEVSDVLNAVQKVSHFGYGGRKDMPMGQGHDIVLRAKENRFLASVEMFNAMSDHLGTQGDGNHFFYVGEKESNRELTFVTHHGSRKPGALLYKKGMQIAKMMTKEVSSETPDGAAWIPFDSDEGREYWEALQIIREWTKYNHTVIHDAVMRELGIKLESITDRFWNAHNFVFRKGDMFYHAKGATPVQNDDFDADQFGRTIIPLNMGEPILIVKNHDSNAFGYAPHGAGRNFSRTQFGKMNNHKTALQIMKEEVSHIDARFYSGDPDMSELPSAYKNAEEVQKQIASYKLANVVDRVLPLGSMMAGNQVKPWLDKKERKTEK